MEKTAKTLPSVNFATPRTWIITGAAGGIGQCIVIYLLKTNQRVIATDVTFSEAFRTKVYEVSQNIYSFDIEEVYKETRKRPLSKRISPECSLIACDLSKTASISLFTQLLQEEKITLDVLVNNAASSDNKQQPWNTHSFEQILKINLQAPFQLISELRSCFHPKGSVVNICSTRAHQSQAHTPGYSASKGGLLALTHSLAISLGPDIRVNALTPGWINTTSCGFYEDVAETEPTGNKLSLSDEKQHPSGRVGNPMDVIRGLMYLTDPENSFVTGQELVIDGGMSKRMIYHGDEGWSLNFFQ